MQLTVIVLLVLIPSITTLKCYVCNSNDNTLCEDVTKLKRFEQQCPQADEPYCRKMNQIVDNVKSVVRSCGSKIGAKACYKTAGANTANVCSCKEDLCNHAPSFNRQQQLITIVSSMIVVAISMIVLR